MISERKSLAQLCWHAYWDIPEAARITRENLTAFVLPGTPAVVVFQGSNDVPDWFVNFDATFATHPWGRVHAGFYRSWLRLRDAVSREIGLRPAILTGHSLGGALAVLAAHDIVYTSKVVTFGAPRVGDNDFVSGFQAAMLGHAERYVYQFDPVPLLPGYLAGYRHPTPPIWFDGESWLEGYSWAERVRQGWRLSGTWKHLLKFLWCHAAARYATAA